MYQTIDDAEFSCDSRPRLHLAVRVNRPDSDVIVIVWGLLKVASPGCLVVPLTVDLSSHDQWRHTTCNSSILWICIRKLCQRSGHSMTGDQVDYNGYIIGSSAHRVVGPSWWSRLFHGCIRKLCRSSAHVMTGDQADYSGYIIGKSRHDWRSSWLQWVYIL